MNFNEFIKLGEAFEDLKKYRVTWVWAKGPKGDSKRTVYVLATNPQDAMNQVENIVKTSRQQGGLGRSWGEQVPEIKEVDSLPEVMHMINKGSGHAIDPYELNILLKALQTGQANQKVKSQVEDIISKNKWLINPHDYQQEFKRSSNMMGWNKDADFSNRVQNVRKMFDIIKQNRRLAIDIFYPQPNEKAPPLLAKPTPPTPDRRVAV